MNKKDADFIQKGFLKKRRFKITDQGVECYEKTGLEEWTYTIPFEEIIQNPLERLTYSKLWLVLMLGSIIFAAMDFVEYYLMQGVLHSTFLTWISVAVVISTINFFASLESLVFYSLGRFHLGFLKGKPSEEKISDFVEKIQDAQIEYFEYKHSVNNIQYAPSVHEQSIADEIYKLNMLLEQGLIDEEEFEKGKGQILRKEKEAERRIGF